MIGLTLRILDAEWSISAVIKYSSAVPYQNLIKVIDK